MRCNARMCEFRRRGMMHGSCDNKALLWYNVRNMTIEEQTQAIVKALEERKGTDIKVYDVRGKSQLADCFVVATGAAAPHLKALIAETQAAMKALGVASYRTSGDPESGWIVVDYIDIVVHVFSPEARAYYALEKLWA